MPVISIATLKGGTAKTTTAVNLAGALHRKGYSVLLIDSDPQANLTYSMGAPDDCKRNLYTEYKREIQGEESKLRETIIETSSGPGLIPSSIHLGNTEQELVSKLAREHTLRRRMLRPIVDDYDFILVDCPPSFGMLTVNALVASDYILVPLQGEFLPKKGVENFLTQLNSLKETLNLKIEVAGFLLTRYSPRKKMNEEIKNWMNEHYPGKLFRTFIHTDIRLAAAQKKGIDIFSYAPHSVAAGDYENLADEFLASVTTGAGIDEVALVAKHSLQGCC
jgi:chromosome partitioning protein